MAFRVPEQYRVQVGARVSDYGDKFGCFLLPPSRLHKIGVALRCIAADGSDWARAQAAGAVPLDTLPWEHVSVSVQPGMTARPRCPSWEEMCFVKSIFWEEEDCVMQLHPPKSDYVNESPYCLHLWRPIGVEIPRPPAICVGMKKGERNG